VKTRITTHFSISAAMWVALIHISICVVAYLVVIRSLSNLDKPWPGEQFLIVLFVPYFILSWLFLGCCSPDWLKMWLPPALMLATLFIWGSVTGFLWPLLRRRKSASES
jgi:hypothetical protein